MKRIQISQIGLGAWGQKIQGRLRELSEFEFVGNASRSLPEMLENFIPDLILISTPVESHLELAKYAIEKNCHVWITKPIVLHSKDLMLLQELALKKNRRIFYDHTYLFNAQFNAISAALPTLSSLKKIHVRRGHSGGHQNLSTALEEVLYHDIYMALAWIQELPLSLCLNVEDKTHILELQFLKTQVRLEGSLDWPDRQRVVSLNGNDWNIEWKEDQLFGAGLPKEISEPKDAIQKEFLDIYHALNSGRSAKVDDVQAQKVLKIIELARQSLQKKGTHLSYA